MTASRIAVLTAGLLAVTPVRAAAQTKSPWSIVTVTTQVCCPAFMISSNILQA